MGQRGSGKDFTFFNSLFECQLKNNTETRKRYHWLWCTNRYYDVRFSRGIFDLLYQSFYTETTHITFIPVKFIKVESWFIIGTVQVKAE